MIPSCIFAFIGRHLSIAAEDMTCAYLCRVQHLTHKCSLLSDSCQLEVSALLSVLV